MFGVQSWRFALQSERTTVGKAPENDIVLDDDPTASHLHAMLERFPAGWCVTDLGLLERHLGQRRADLGVPAAAPRRRDPLGQTRLIFRDPLSAGGAQTEAEDASADADRPGT